MYGSSSPPVAQQKELITHISMACSTMMTTNARTTSNSWKFKVLHGDSFKCIPKTCYIHAPTPQGLKQTIISTLKKLHFYGQNVIAQFWGPTETGTHSILLTTTYQPAVIYGNNEEFLSYHEAFLQQKYYINKENLVAFGLPGRVFLTCTPQQTTNVHRYPEDQRPPGLYAFFSMIWGSFCVPVIEGDRCVGVLEFVTDLVKDSYDNDIAVVQTALENAGLQTSIKIENLFQNCNLETSTPIAHPKKTKRKSRKRVRRTRSSCCTKYNRLVPQFGHPSSIAADNLGLKRSTFGNVRRDVEIYEWPWISNTTWRASSAHGTQINPTASSETSSCGTSEASDDIYLSKLSEIDNMKTELPEETTIIVKASAPDSSEDISNLSEFLESINGDFPEWPYEQTILSRTSPPETQNYHVALDENWIEKERERVDFMQEFNDLIDQGNEAPGMEDIDMVDAFFDYNRWDKDQEQWFGLIAC